MRTREDQHRPLVPDIHEGFPPVSVPRTPSRMVRSAVRRFGLVPLLVLGTMVGIGALNRDPVPGPGPKIYLRSTTGSQVTALVFGAGSGIHVLRVSDKARVLPVDLARGPLRVVALRSIQLNASGVDEAGYHILMAKGPILRLGRGEFGSAYVSTGF